MTARARSTSVVWNSLAVLLGVTGSVACVDETVAPEPAPEPPAGPRMLGFVELTFDNIGSPDMSTSVITAPSLAALEELRAERDRRGETGEDYLLDLSLPRNVDNSGDGTIQIGTASGEEFVFGIRRYLQATFNVRNAQLDGTPYDTERTNLVFYAVSTDNTINGTSIRRLELEDGSPAAPALATAVLPTGFASTEGGLTVDHPDVLQILTEGEVAALDPPAGVNSIFPYGFVVRNPSSQSDRTLPASPGPSQFDGVVDLAFAVPLQQDPADEPRRLVFMMLAVDDSDVRITQSREGQQLRTARLAFRQRANNLDANVVTLLPGGAVPGFPGARTLCTVRTGGPANAPSAFLVNSNWRLQSLMPTTRTVPRNTDFEAVFDEPVEGADPQTFSVQGAKSGWAFHNAAYTGNGTSTITTPQGAFTPGEKITVTLTNVLSCPTPTIATYRAQSGPATGNFVADDSSDTGEGPAFAAVGDLTGSGDLDLVTVDTTSQTLSVLLGSGDGTFTPQSPLAAGPDPVHVATADVDEDGNLDLGVANRSSNAVNILLGAGDGTFPNQQSISVGTDPTSVVLHDLDGDGALDLATANNDGTLSVLMGNADGSFHEHTTYAVGPQPRHLAVHDLDGDGFGDFAFATNSGNIITLLGNGDGTFQAPLTSPAGGEPQRFVALGYLDGDDAIDLVFVASSEGDVVGNAVHVMLGNGDGTFQAPQRFETGETGANAGMVVIEDLTGNGVLDLVTPNLDGANVTAFFGAGDGTFPTSQSFPLGGEKRVAVTGDMNDDTVIDLAVATSDDVVWVLLGEPDTP